MKNTSLTIKSIWLFSLAIIPLLSIYGRPIQKLAKDNLSPDQLTLFIGLALLLISSKAIFWLIKRHAYQKIWHLSWFIPLFLVVPFFMPIIEERVHFIVFGSFGFLSMLIFSPKVAISICISVSIMDEGLQHYLPDRVGDLFDIAVNIIASIAGAMFSYISWKQKC